jgi:hypothetical protein
MALQPDLVHEAEDSSQEDYLLGLNLSNQDSLLIPEAPILTVRTYSQTLILTPYIVLTTTSDLLRRQGVSIRDSSINNPLIKCHHLHMTRETVRSLLLSQMAPSLSQERRQPLNRHIGNNHAKLVSL